jgi:predicted transcriptional regulator
VKIIVPAVHLNGTSKESLVEALENAYTSVGNAYDSLRECAPNGRDYYIYKDNPFERAREEWRNRMERLDSVRRELEAIAAGIVNNEMEVEIDE